MSPVTGATGTVESSSFLGSRDKTDTPVASTSGGTGKGHGVHVPCARDLNTDGPLHTRPVEADGYMTETNGLSSHYWRIR